MSPRPNFTHSSNTAYIMTGTSLKFLLAILNSTLLSFYFPLISTDVRGKTRRYIKQYVENLPVVEMNEQGRICFEVFAEYLLILKKHAQKLQAAYFEQLIDGLLYEFYDPEHPIRNTLEPLDSVEEVRIIQQAVPR